MADGGVPGSTVSLVQVVTTVSSREEAERLGLAVVRERLAACAQVSGPVTSIYRWQGTVEQATEWYCILKTSLARTEALSARLQALHSYDVPEIIALPVLHSHVAYAAWVEDSVSPVSSPPETTP